MDDESKVEPIVSTAEPKEANGFSIGSFLTAIASFLILLLQPSLAVILAVLAVFLAAFGLRHSNGRWMAGVGLALGLIHILIWIFFVGGILLTTVDWEALG